MLFILEQLIISMTTESLPTESYNYTQSNCICEPPLLNLDELVEGLEFNSRDLTFLKSTCKALDFLYYDLKNRVYNGFELNAIYEEDFYGMSIHFASLLGYDRNNSDIQSVVDRIILTYVDKMRDDIFQSCEMPENHVYAESVIVSNFNLYRVSAAPGAELKYKYIYYVKNQFIVKVEDVVLKTSILDTYESNVIIDHILKFVNEMVAQGQHTFDNGTIEESLKFTNTILTHLKMNLQLFVKSGYMNDEDVERCMVEFHQKLQSFDSNKSLPDYDLDFKSRIIKSNYSHQYNDGKDSYEFIYFSYLDWMYKVEKRSIRRDITSEHNTEHHY
jgi:hypothetical protein